MPFAYDQIAYPSYSHPQTQPDRLATIARLYGVAAPAIENASVLEIGCGDAVNLAAVAVAWPNSRCVGFDLSSTAIARGQAMAGECGIENLKLFEGDVTSLDMSELGGPFDYVIAHGFYTWTPQAVRDAALSLARSNLSQNGLAYFSYDVFPGAHLKMISRQVMLAGAAGVNRSADPIRFAKTAKAAIAAATDLSGNEPWSALLKGERERITKLADEGVLHDDLADVYSPCAFGEFAANANQHGLLFVCEADAADIWPAKLSDAARSMLARIGGENAHIRREEVADLIRGRRFRQSILCRQEVTKSDRPDPRAVESLYLCGRLKEESNPPGAAGTTFRAGDTQGTVTINHPVAVATLRALGEKWPACVRGDELRRAAAAAANMRSDDQPLQAAFTETIFATAGARLIEMHSAPPPAAITLPEKPRASRLVQWQMSRGNDPAGTHVSTLTGRTANLRGDAAKSLVQLTDGTRTIPEIIEAMKSKHAAGQHAEAFVQEVNEKLNALIGLRLIHE